MDIIIRLLMSKNDIIIENHKKFERRGIVNYLYHNKPIVIINRKRRVITVNNWRKNNTEIEGIDEIIEKYLNSNTINYLLKNANYKLMDRRGV